MGPGSQFMSSLVLTTTMPGKNGFFSQSIFLRQKFEQEKESQERGKNTSLGKPSRGRCHRREETTIMS